MYGHSDCLDHAIRCVALRVRQYLGGEVDRHSDAVFSYHAAALKSLGYAVRDPVKARQPEVLCTAEVLAIYELLEFGNPQAWIVHIAGASSLLRLRGPESCTTDFEKALLLALVGPIYTEAMISGSICFLDDQSWKKALTSSVLEYTTFSDCSEIVISLWVRNVGLPRLFNDVQHAIRYSHHLRGSELNSLISRVATLRGEVKSWRGSYDVLVMASSLRSAAEQANMFFDRRFEAFGVCLASTAILTRLAAALQPEMIPQLEVEAQMLALEISALEETAKTENPRAHLFMAFKMIVANSIFETEREWRDAFAMREEEPTPFGVLPWRVFERWVIMKGRKVEGSDLTFHSRYGSW